MRWPRKDEQGNWYDKFYRFAYLPWGICCASYCLAAGLKYLINQAAKANPEHAKILQEILDAQYADDLNTGADTLEEMEQVAAIMEETASKASMPLGKHKCDPASLATDLYGLDPSHKPYQFLGCGFDPEMSCFYVPLNRLFEFEG
jgi:hypothetical protein